MTSPIRRTSKRPSSGSASGHIIIPPPRKRPLQIIASIIRPLRDLAVDGDAHLSGLPAEEDATGSPSSTRPCRRAPSTTRSRAARSRREMPALATFANSVRLVAARPRAVRGDAEVDRHAPRPSARRRSPVEVARDVEGAHEVPARATRDHGELDPRRVADAVHDLVHRCRRRRRRRRVRRRPARPRPRARERCPGVRR